MKTIDDLRAALATSGKADDECVLAFYAWKEAQEWACMFMEDGIKDTTNALAGWFERGIKPVTIEEVADWLKEWYDPDAIGGTDEELMDLIEEYKQWR